MAKDTLAITINNHLFPSHFIENTKNLAESFGISHEIVDINFYNDEYFLSNDSSRCYTCRNLMYSKIEELAEKRGFDYICDGNNISDLVVDRPGILITYKKGFNTPFIEAKLTSKDIHEYLNKNDIPVLQQGFQQIPEPLKGKSQESAIAKTIFKRPQIVKSSKLGILKSLL